MRSFEGQRIGPYELSSRIGSGGMGVVYRALDTRLDRTVAIKVLAAGAGGEHARERFDRDGRAIAALNHPHICALYDIGETTLPADDPTTGAPEAVQFLVMEHLEGETLASRLTRGPLPLAEALRYAEQIASALEAAHRAGIVHRDLKPGNIFLVPAGGASPVSNAKLLDFGLAKTAATVRSSDLTVTKMRSPDLTMLGTMVGTVQYMAPEQIQGKDADARADIFAFGAVLFEMLTGRKAFEGDSQAQLMVSILDRDPPRISALQPSTPPWVEQLIDWCLAKPPDQRWRSASDILRELQSTRERSVSGSAGVGAASRARFRRRLAIVGVIAIAALAAIAFVAWRRSITAAPPGLPKAALAVLPLLAVDSPDADDTHLGVGIADAILTRLANVHSIRVRPTSAIVAFNGRTVDPIAAAHQLQVDHVLTGTVRRLGDAYRFNLQLIRAGDGVLVWGRQIDVSRRDLFGVEDQVTTEVVAALQVEISSGERARLSQRYTENADAYDEYLQGRALLANYSDSNMRGAIEHFERALRIDPDYVLADAGMATAAGISSVRFAYDLQQATEWGRRAGDYARRASRRDADLGEVHLALASAAGTLYRNFDWATVIREADAALAQNPNLDLAHSALARPFYHIGQLDWSELESQPAEEASGGANNIEVDPTRGFKRS